MWIIFKQCWLWKIWIHIIAKFSGLKYERDLRSKTKRQASFTKNMYILCYQWHYKSKTKRKEYAACVLQALKFTKSRFRHSEISNNRQLLIYIIVSQFLKHLLEYGILVIHKKLGCVGFGSSWAVCFMKKHENLTQYRKVKRANYESLTIFHAFFFHNSSALTIQIDQLTLTLNRSARRRSISSSNSTSLNVSLCKSSIW